ncbi:hypothetical protein F4808DRAFT_349089 [Astrocystis sublimbata]|nr:hypothetical protein F4808DRAFT_349089 [Astrocystis sublimbata]
MGDPRNDRSELDRRSSRRTSATQPDVPGDGVDDDYMLQAMGISDGFRPSQLAQDHDLSQASRPSVSSTETPLARDLSDVPPRPSSMSKPPPAHQSFSRPDGQFEPSPARSSSMSAEAPYEGPSGPSHPYQMYSQDVRATRTASLATTSTMPISERSYNGPGRPTHPYGIYPQNVATGVDEPSTSSQGDVNVGFPGRSGEYQRRIGPDGEEAADMIGPHGHTEQLPPYSRYPVEAYGQKSPGSDASQPAASPTPTQRNLEIPGAGGLGLATRNPEFSSTEDLNQVASPQSRQSIRSFTSEASHHSINTAALTVTNEKPEPNWKALARRKFWGVVPCWAVVLGVLILVLLAVIIGAVIGTVFASHLNSKDHDKNPYGATNTAPGFVPLPTVPPGLPALAEGPYALPLVGPSYSNTCFQDPNHQGRAWNCEAIMSQLTMSIRKRHNAADITAYALDFYYNESFTQESFTYTYGVQPPLLFDQQLQLVNDSFERSLGPAWAFALPYNKTVILPEEYLSPTNTSSLEEVQRRRSFGFNFKRKGLAQLGDRPWICTWPGTLLEVFIYAGHNSSFKYPTSPDTTTSAPPLPIETPASPTEYTKGARGLPYDGGDHELKWPVPSHPAQVTSMSTTTASMTSTTSTSTSTSTTEPDYFYHAPVPTPLYPPYPRVIKVEERRNSQPDGPVPVCRQVEIIDKGVPALPVTDDKGVPIEIQIAEVQAEVEYDETEDENHSRRRSLDQQLWSRDDGSNSSEGNELSDCGCIWWVT